MRTANLKRKGISFQKEAAEMIARKFALTIEALSPKSVGKISNGVTYVSENDTPDLRVRGAGEAGIDVTPVSEKAHRCFPFALECKHHRNISSPWSLLGRDATRLTGLFIEKWLAQVEVHVKHLNDSGSVPLYSLAVFRQNRSAVMCAFKVKDVLNLVPAETLLTQYFPSILLFNGQDVIGVTSFEQFIDTWHDTFSETYQFLRRVSG